LKPKTKVILDASQSGFRGHRLGETIARGYAPCHNNRNTPVNVLRDKNFELNIFSKSYSENADQSQRKKAFLLREHTQTQQKVVEFDKKFYNSPKQWIGGE
jgi:hypothetical protein